MDFIIETLEQLNDPLFFKLLFGVMSIIILAVILGFPNCPQCSRKIWNNGKVVDREYIDTTPQKSDGSNDLRYKRSGYTEILREWNCRCGHTFQKWIKKI